jgi:putative membrane protein
MIEEARPSQSNQSQKKVPSLFRDFVLACLHHLAVFALVAILAIELVLVRPELDAATVKRLGRIDLAFGVAAGAVIVAGVARVFFGFKGPAYYFGNWVFWTKIGIFALICFLSIGPTLRILAWGRRVKADPQALPSLQDIKEVKRIIHIEVALVLLLPILGAAMARGYGLP